MKTGCLDLPQVNHAAGWMRWSRIMIGAGYFKPFRPLIRIHQNPTQRCCRPHWRKRVFLRGAAYSSGIPPMTCRWPWPQGLGLSGFHGGITPLIDLTRPSGWQRHHNPYIRRSQIGWSVINDRVETKAILDRGLCK